MSNNSGNSLVVSFWFMFAAAMVVLIAKGDPTEEKEVEQRDSYCEVIEDTLAVMHGWRENELGYGNTLKGLLVVGLGSIAYVQNDEHREKIATNCEESSDAFWGMLGELDEVANKYEEIPLHPDGSLRYSSYLYWKKSLQP